MAKVFSRQFPVTWDEFHRNARALAWKLADGAGSGRPFDGIVAVTRGGLVPAAIVARELDMRVIDTIGVVTYRGQEAGMPSVVKPLCLPGDGDGLVIIDDLVDTGITARKVREILPRAHFATVYAKPLGKPLVDSFISEVSQDTWIVFPWDRE